MFFDDIKTLYDLDAPETGRIRVEQTYSDYRKGRQGATGLAGLSRAAGAESVIDLDTARPLATGKTRRRSHESWRSTQPIADDRQSAHLKPHGHDRRMPVLQGLRGGRARLRATCTASQHRRCFRRDGTCRPSAVRNDRHVSGPRVRRVDQPERRKQVQGHHSRPRSERA